MLNTGAPLKVFVQKSDAFRTVSYFLETCRRIWREVSLDQNWGWELAGREVCRWAFPTVNGRAT